MALSVQELAAAHNRSGFDCGSEPLNTYLRQTAKQHAERNISRSFVLAESQQPTTILGFYTLSLCQIKTGILPPEVARKFPRDAGALKLGRLAVALSHQRKGFGAMLLADAFARCRAVAAHAAGIGLFVDAKDESAQRYYQSYGFVPLTGNPLQLFLPMTTILRAVTP